MKKTAGSPNGPGQVGGGAELDPTLDEPNDVALRATEAAKLAWEALKAREKASAAAGASNTAWADLSAAELEAAKARLRQMLDMGGPPDVKLSLSELERHQKAYFAGDRFALAQALNTCAMAELPLPKWAADAFTKAFADVANLRAESWSQALGWPHRKGAHRDSLRHRLEIRGEVWLRVMVWRWAFGHPIDKGLFEKVGRQFGIGATLCEQLYREARARGAPGPRKSRKMSRNRSV